MPVSVVKSPEDERRWKRAKDIATKSGLEPGKKEFWAYTMGVFKRMSGKKKSEPFLSENLTLKPGSSPRETSDKKLVYLTNEKEMAAAYAAGFVQSAHAYKPTRFDGVIFVIDGEDMHEAGGDVWESYKDDLAQGAQDFLDDDDTHDREFFERFADDALRGNERAEMARIAVKNVESVRPYMDTHGWLMFQFQEQGYAEIAVESVPWSKIIQIEEYEEGKVTHKTPGGSKRRVGEDALYHGAPLDHWEDILKKLPGREKLVEPEDFVSECVDDLMAFSALKNSRRS